MRLFYNSMDLVRASQGGWYVLGDYERRHHRWLILAILDWITETGR